MPLEKELLDQVRDALRTEEAYVNWITRSILFITNDTLARWGHPKFARF
jgi:hypothetical protein